MIEIVFKLDENKAIAYDSENKVGECDFEKIDDIWNITHTEVDSDYQGQGIARKLVENVIENADIPESLQETMIKSADIPEVFKNLLLKNNNKEMYDELGVTTFPQYIGAYVARLVINIIAFILTFIVVTVIIRAVVFALDIVSELPVIGFFNHLAGGALGIGIALIIVWILFMIVTLMYTTAVGKEIYEMVQNNSILKLIYDCNPVMRLAVKLI